MPSPPPCDYALLDFGDGRRLERFASIILDRPCPAAQNPKQDRSLWKKADAVFLLDDSAASQRGKWQAITAVGAQFLSPSLPVWNVHFGLFQLELRLTPFGHVGVFPEQQTNWRDITALIASRLTVRPQHCPDPIRVLNLFAYTGGSSLAAARGGHHVEVVHVDAAKSVVDWAKRNAERNFRGASHLGRIRWIVENARKFVQREIKRKNRYDAIILDPPSYGHGTTKKSVWKIEEHLPDLLVDLSQLLSDSPLFLLLTAHSDGFSAERLLNLLGKSGSVVPLAEAMPLDLCLTSQSGNILPAGSGVRLTW